MTSRCSLFRILAIILTSHFYLASLSANLQTSTSQLVSTESDPDAFIESRVNVINGAYCESVTDLVITGPDDLVLQRFYNNKDVITGTQSGSWRIFPQRFLVLGKHLSEKSCLVGKDKFEWFSGFTGERSGGILPYDGWRNTNGYTKDPLKIDILNTGKGIVNTYTTEMNGQTNHQNNLLHCKDSTCELTLGDGTLRIYQKIQKLPSLILGEELIPLMANQVINPDFFLLTKEILPNGNQILFSYDTEGHLISVEMKNKTLNKTYSWINFSYDFRETTCIVNIQTSDARNLIYHFAVHDNLYQLTKVDGSHCMPTSYEYIQALIKKTLPEARFIEIDYQDGKVKSLKGPDAKSGNSVITYSFSYEKEYTDVFNAIGTKTRYINDKHFQLTAIERYDEQNNLYRIEKKFWGKTESDAGLLLAKTISDGTGRTFSYRSFQYDKSGNVIEERFYGNLTGKQEILLQVSSDGKLLNTYEEYSIKKFSYSNDGFNLLTKVGDCKGNETLYIYKPRTNLLVKKFILDRTFIKNRTFHHYNEDDICTRTIEDDGMFEIDYQIHGVEVKERHIKVIKPKETLPGVGLPEIIEEKVLELKNKKEILIRKLVNTYDKQSNLLSCDTYDSNDNYAFTETNTYNSIGQITSHTDASGKITTSTYDGIGNLISVSIPQENKFITTSYDLRNQPIEQIVNGKCINKNTYDSLGRKIASTDQFGNSTNFEYDSFNRLTKVIHPEVFDENQKIVRPTFSYSYDIFGNIITIKDPKDFVTTKSYNLRGSPTKITYPDGSFELFKYDAEGSLHRSLNRDQITTVYEYDYLGRLTYEELSTNTQGSTNYLTNRYHNYNGFRCVQDKKDGCTKQYLFDSAGRLTSIAEDAGWNKSESRLTEIMYDPLGRIHRKKVWFDVGPQDYSLEFFEYDLSGNIIEKRIENDKGVILLKRQFSYDAQGNCIEEYNIENDVKVSFVKTIYNSDGESIAYQDGLDQETKIIIDNNYQNELGQTVLKKTLISPIGVQTIIEFDALSRIYAISKKGSSDVLLSSQKILYDTLGNKACEIHYQIVEGNIIGFQKIIRVYGPMGRLEEEVEAAETPLEKRTKYSYNYFGKMIRKTSSGSETPINYIYNSKGNISKIEVQNDKGEVQISNNYSYDGRGNILSAYSYDGRSVEKTYNAFDKVTQEIIKDGQGMYLLVYCYDKKGRIKKIVLPDSSKIAYVYDGVFGREVQRISAQGKILYTHAYNDYDTQGRLLSESHIGYAGQSEYTYDLNGQKISEKNDFFSKQYNRDALGRLIEVKGEKSEEYSYNDLSQLTVEKKENTKTYSYDSLDNRIKVDNEELINNVLNQLTATSVAEFSYDQQGNLLRKVLDGEETRFENNALSQLTSIEKADQTTLTFAYDAFGRLLVEKHLDGKARNKKVLSNSRYFYLGHQEIGTLTETGSIETLKIPGLHGDELSQISVAFEISGERYVPLHDIAGNVISLVDPQSREIIENYQYTAFGEEAIYDAYGELQEGSIIGNPWRFAEKRKDQKSGLILFGLRFYDPINGRWISQDPAGFIDGPNLYSYIHNNPLHYFDRFGLATETNSQNRFAEYFYGEVENHCYCETHRNCKRGGDIGKTAGSAFPKITYDDLFEKFYKDYRSEDLFINDRYRNSSYYDLSEYGLPDLPSDLGIGFINGIWNDLKMSRESAQYSSKLAGGYNIHAVHNATHGTVKDIFECGLGLNYIATEPVKQLHKMWNNFFEKSSESVKFLMICHSQGAIHVRNGLLDYNPELRKRIMVVAIAPAAYIYQETCDKVIHYRANSWRDFVPRIDIYGTKRAKGTVEDLDSHINAKAFDHEFMSPTYEKKLKRHIIRSIRSQGAKI